MPLETRTELSDRPESAIRPPSPGLVDGLGRRIRHLRVSVTDRCNLRCTYCMTEKMVFMDRELILSYEEIARFVRILAPLGITKVRVTGGEPLVRKGVAALIRYLAAIDGLTDIAMTTNGILLKQHAAELKAAGLRRVNVSLDTLNPLKYKEITRRDALEQVLEGLGEAERVGLRPLKINVVAIRGFTDTELLDFARFARERNTEVRFIEFMPLDAEDAWEKRKILPGNEILDAIGAHYPLEPLNNSRAEPAALYRFKDGAGGRIGVITSGTGPFCQDCNRIRLTSDGKLRTCLFSVQETDVRALLRSGVPDEAIAACVIQAVRGKEPSHRINSPDFVRPGRTMHLIGG